MTYIIFGKLTMNKQILVSKFLYEICQSHNQNLTDLIADILMMHPQKTLNRILPLFDVIMEIGPEKYFSIRNYELQHLIFRYFRKFVPTVGLPKLNSLLGENDEDFYERSCLYSVELETVNKVF